MAASIPTTPDRSALMTLVLLAATLAVQPLHAQDDWRHWGRDAGNQRTRR